MQALYQDFCKAPKVLSESERSVLPRLHSALREFLWRKAKRLVTDSVDVPLLVSYQSDATSHVCKAISIAQASEAHIVRHGRVLAEFLVERGFIKVRSFAGKETVAFLVQAPRALYLGKSCYHGFSAACEFLPSLRQWGHQSILVDHVAFDRAVFSSMVNKLHARVELFYAEYPFSDDSLDSRLLYLLHWEMPTACSFHDVQKALQWGVSQYSSCDMVSKLHIVVASCRNSFRLLVEELPEFVRVHMQYSEEVYCYDDVLQFWTALGAEPSRAQDLARAHIRWQQGALLVNACMRSEPDPLGSIVTLIMYLFKWQPFTDTRWCKSTPACQSLISSCAVGLQALVGRVRADGSKTDFHLHGFSNFDMPLRKLAVLTGICGAVANSILLELFDDGRVARRLAELEMCVRDEVKYIQDLAPYTWERLAGIIGQDGYTGLQLHADAQHVSHIIAGFIDHKVFREARQLPWSLVRNDVSANLAELRARDAATLSGAAWKIHALLARGFPQACIEHGIRLFGDISWGTDAAERGHGSGAVLHRYHPEYVPATLAQRSAIHQCRTLFAPVPRERYELRTKAKLAALLRRAPVRSGGRQVFFGDFMHEARAAAGERGLTRAATKLVMRAHSLAWDGLEPHVQAHYEELAAVGADVKMAENEAEIEHLKAALLLHEERAREGRLQKGLSHVLTDGRFTAADWDELASIYNNASDFCASRARLLQAPSVPPLDVRQALEEHLHPAAAQRSDPWVARACINRDHIVGVAFCNGEEVDSTTYFYLYGVQRPLELHVMQLRRVPQVLPEYARLSAAERLSAWESYHAHVFEVVGTYTTHLSWTFQPGEDIFVLTDLGFDSDGRVVGDSPAEFLSVWLESLPVTCSTAARTPTTRRPHADAAVFDAHPWLRDFVRRVATAEDDVEFMTHASKPVPDSNADVYDVVAFAWTALEGRLSATVPSSTTSMEEGFFVRYRCASRAGVASSTDAGGSIGAEAAKGPARAWVIRYGLPQSTAFAVARYGSDAATRLAEEWCRRLAYYYGLWRRCGEDPEHIFTDAEIGSYEALPEWHEFFVSLDPSDVARERAMDINSLAPSRLGH